MKIFLKTFRPHIDLWIRAHITQRAHWLRVFDEATYYADIDHILEGAVYQLAKRYLYNELGEKVKMKSSDVQLWGKDNFYKGFRMHSVGEETRIDICLEYMKAYEEKDNIDINKYTDYNIYNDDVDKAEERLSIALLAFVKERKSLWT